MDVPQPAKAKRLRLEPSQFEQTVLLLQGGGALGSYQAGVYQALAEADLDPDWVAGIKCGVDCGEPAGEPRREIARVLGGRQHATPRGPASRFNRNQRRCYPSFHQSDARVRHHVIRRAAFFHAPSALPDVLAVTKGQPAQLL